MNAGKTLYDWFIATMLMYILVGVVGDVHELTPPIHFIIMFFVALISIAKNVEDE